MKSILRRSASPTLAIALMALFVSLGGVSYGLASGSINSREIKDNTIRSRDIRNNTIRSVDLRNNDIRGRDIRNSTIQGRDVALDTLTGDDIDESRLGQVPSAASADRAASADTAASATSAQNASTVGGLAVRKFFAKQPPGTAAAEIFRGDTFVIRAGCSGGGDPILQLDGLAGAPATNLGFLRSDAASGAFHGTNLALGPGSNVSLTGPETRVTGSAVVSTTDGRVATIVYAADAANAFAGEGVCAARGTVTSG